MTFQRTPPSGPPLARRLPRPERWGCVLAVLALLAGGPARAGGLPAWLPRYDVQIDLDVAGHQAKVHMKATWTNPTQTPTQHLVFNAHSRYVVPDDQIGLTAKTLEILR